MRRCCNGEELRRLRCCTRRPNDCCNADVRPFTTGNDRDERWRAISCTIARWDFTATRIVGIEMKWRQRGGRWHGGRRRLPPTFPKFHGHHPPRQSCSRETFTQCRNIFATFPICVLQGASDVVEKVDTLGTPPNSQQNDARRQTMPRGTYSRHRPHICC